MSTMTRMDSILHGADGTCCASTRSETVWSTLLVLVFTVGLIAAVTVSRTSGAIQWIAGTAALAAPVLGHVAVTRATSARQGGGAS